MTAPPARGAVPPSGPHAAVTPPADGPLVAVLNCGSSSIKAALFGAAALHADIGADHAPHWRGQVSGIGAGPADDAHAPYHDALDRLREDIRQAAGGAPLAAVSHRVVHGGSKYLQPVRVDAAVLADLRAYVPLAPLHQPFALEAIERLLQTRPDLPQIACFDTAFHHTMPRVERMLPLDWSAWTRGVRRYGFHGLSYEYVSHAIAACEGPRAHGRVIIAHLGSGASLCGLHGLRSQATTMGFSALDGLMMGTRCGSVDPGALLYLMQVEGWSVERVGEILYHGSGLKGVSGLSSDPRVLLAAEASDERAAAALELYVRRVVREVGALVAALGGLDLLVFTAGIGEHGAELRARICAALSFLGLAVDDEANQAHAHCISTGGSAIRVLVVPTDEEWIAARHAQQLLGG